MTLDSKTRSILIQNFKDKSLQALNDAELLLNSRSYTGSLNRIYYSLFYMISAIAVKNEFSTSKHSQLIGWFNKNFVKTEIVKRDVGKFIHLAFDRRMEGDYNIFAEFSFEDVSEDFIKAKEIIKILKKLV